MTAKQNSCVPPRVSVMIPTSDIPQTGFELSGSCSRRGLVPDAEPIIQVMIFISGFGIALAEIYSPR
jgi:hypothetical protein